MLGSRYLFPYFGGGIGTWASLISTVLCALAIGYFAGGAIVDRYPSLAHHCRRDLARGDLSGAGSGDRRSGHVEDSQFHR